MVLFDKFGFHIVVPNNNRLYQTHKREEKYSYHDNHFPLVETPWFEQAIFSFDFGFSSGDFLVRAGDFFFDSAIRFDFAREDDAPTDLTPRFPGDFPFAIPRDFRYPGFVC